MMETSVQIPSVVLTSLVVSAVWVTTCVSPAPSATPASPSLPLATTSTPSPVCPDIHEPNDTVKQARFMQFLAVEGYICHPGDVDVFRTPATYGGYLVDFTVDLYDLPADYDLYVFYQGTEIACSTHRGLTPEHVYYFSGPRTANSYELKVVGANGAFDPNRPYRLRFTMNPGAPIPTGHE